MGLIMAQQLATGLGLLAGAALVKSIMEQQPMAGPGARCPSCNGTGRVSCLCSRWSDDDKGCRTCAGSGRMACGSCGGSGFLQPAADLWAPFGWPNELSFTSFWV